MRREFFLAALLAAVPPFSRTSRAASSEDSDEEARAPAANGAYRNFTSVRRTFSCDVPIRGWRAFEEETPLGSATHFLGPSELRGAWRAALHVNFIEKTQPGFVAIEDAVKRAHGSEPSAERKAGPIRRWRVARQSARRFEVTQTRMVPPDRLPAAPAVLHHYLAFVPAGDGYFTIDLSTSRDTYLDYRQLYERVLQTFRILGYQ